MVGFDFLGYRVGSPIQITCYELRHLELPGRQSWAVRGKWATRKRGSRPAQTPGWECSLQCVVQTSKTHPDLLPSTMPRKFLLTLTGCLLQPHTCLRCPGCSQNTASQATQLWHPLKRSVLHSPSAQYQQKSLPVSTFLFLHAPKLLTRAS